ncbi:hypothetical protein SAMN05216299_107133 [Nitrosospira sp. Nsp14]|nr:hypothetical protein SAMN05216299_107133 [Nitrosospira sp. Nsp14]
MSASNCRQVPGRDPQARETISPEGTFTPLWLGIKLCSSSPAATRDKAQQTQTSQQHGVGFWFGDGSQQEGVVHTCLGIVCIPDNPTIVVDITCHSQHRVA